MTRASAALPLPALRPPTAKTAGRISISLSVSPRPPNCPVSSPIGPRTCTNSTSPCITSTSHPARGFTASFSCPDLQVDLAFVPAAEFSPLAPTFRLIFGQATQPRHLPPPVPADLIGLAWLYALHVRSSIARHRLWQAEYMIAGVRNHALALACIRHGLPAIHGRGIDQLPSAVITPFEDSLVRRLDLAELSRAFEAVLSVLLSEAKLADPQLAARLESSLTGLSESLH